MAKLKYTGRWAAFGDGTWELDSSSAAPAPRTPAPRELHPGRYESHTDFAELARFLSATLALIARKLVWWPLRNVAFPLAGFVLWASWAVFITVTIVPLLHLCKAGSRRFDELHGGWDLIPSILGEDDPAPAVLATAGPVTDPTEDDRELEPRQTYAALPVGDALASDLIQRQREAVKR